MRAFLRELIASFAAIVAATLLSTFFVLLMNLGTSGPYKTVASDELAPIAAIFAIFSAIGVVFIGWPMHCLFKISKVHSCWPYLLVGFFGPILLSMIFFPFSKWPFAIFVGVCGIFPAAVFWWIASYRSASCRICPITQRR